MKKSTDSLLDDNQFAFAMNALRRGSYKWPALREVMYSARRVYPPLPTKKGKPGAKPRVRYECNECKKEYKTTEIRRDHIEPVINPSTGTTTLSEFARRLLVYPSGWQILCDGCHKAKSAKENEVRRMGRTRKASFPRGRRQRGNAVVSKTSGRRSGGKGD